MIRAGWGLKGLGVEWAKPLAAMSDTIKIIRGLLAGEMINFEGQVFDAKNAKLQFDVPIVLATRGNQMLQLAGRLADDVMVATYVQPTGIQHALDLVAAGAQKAGRPVQDVGIISRVDACVWPDSQVARNAPNPRAAPACSLHARLGRSSLRFAWTT